MPTVAERFRLPAAIGASALLAGCYFVTLLSPLRLSSDAVAYLTLARSIATGGDVDPGGAGDFPRGYPALLALLDVIGLGKPWAFVLLNLVFLGGGLLAAYALLRESFAFSRRAAFLVCCAFLLVHEVIWVAPQPMSDAAFFGVAMACLLLLQRSQTLDGARAAWAIGAAALLAIAAFEIRTIGVALWPTVAYACVTRPRIAAGVRQLARRRPAVLAAGAAAVLVMIAAVAYAGLRQTNFRYLHEAASGWDSPASIVDQFENDATSVALLATNTALGRWPDGTHQMRVALGACVLLIVAVGLARRRRALRVADVFAITTMIVLLVWPLNTQRLWIPILPIVMAYVIGAAQVLARARWARIGVHAWAVLFVLAGLAMLGDSVRLSLSGDAFADRWAARDGSKLNATYRVAFRRATPAEVGAIDPATLRLLRHYEERARQ